MRTLIALSFFLMFFYANLLAETVNKIVAVVGTEFLTLYELDSLASPFYEEFIKPQHSPEERERIKAQIRKEVLERWIEDTVIGLEAKKFKVSVNDEELEKFYRAELKNFGGEEQLKALLKAEGKTLEDFQKNLRERLIKIKFIQLIVGSKIAIPEDEIRKAYEERIKKHDPSPKYEIEVLLLSNGTLIGEVESRLQRGESLKNLASHFQDSLTYLKDTFKEEELDRELLSALRTLALNEVSRPIKRGDQYYIIRLVKRLSGEPPKFEDLRETIYEELFNRRAKDYLERWIKELKETKFVKVYL